MSFTSNTSAGISLGDPHKTVCQTTQLPGTNSIVIANTL